jgi:hypothetical protein
MSLLASPVAQFQPSSPTTAEARRRLRVGLLRDLVAHGLYRIPTRELAERLVPVLRSSSPTD